LRATDLTNKFITFSGGGTPRKKVVSVKQMLSKSVLSVLAGSTIEPEFSFQEDLWDIKADIDQLNQAISAVVTNAREAMAQGGTLKIHAINQEQGPAADTTGHVINKGLFVKVSVIDQGPGIAAENLVKIFDPYFSTKARGSIKGMGLGLTIAYSIISRHDGYIHVESPSGAGVCVHIYLPAFNRLLKNFA
jgi:two-component system, cell cycle sensor histidine kinase and response regulator CckA